MDPQPQTVLARLFPRLRRKGPVIALGLCISAALGLILWQYLSTASGGPRETVSIGLTNDELASLRRLISPKPSSKPHGTQLAISQVRDLEERLTALEKAIPLGDSLSAAASNDLRLLQRDIEALKERQVFQGQLIKDQRSELLDQIKVWTGIMVTLILGILAFFWQILQKVQDKKNV